jgi:EVE domain
VSEDDHVERRRGVFVDMRHSLAGFGVIVFGVRSRVSTNLAAMVKTRSGKERTAEASGILLAPTHKKPKVETRNSLGSTTHTRPRQSASMAIRSQLEDAGDKELNYFVFKSEPEPREEKGVDVSFSIDDLDQRENQTEPWDGVRNYEARNTMRRMRVGDLGFFYVCTCSFPPAR